METSVGEPNQEDIQHWTTKRKVTLVLIELRIKSRHKFDFAALSPHGEGNKKTSKVTGATPKSRRAFRAGRTTSDSRAYLESQ